MWKPEEWQLKVILSYIASSRPTWARNRVQKKQRKERKEKNPLSLLDRVSLSSSGCPWTYCIDQPSLNSQRSTWLCFPNVGIEGMCHTWPGGKNPLKNNRMQTLDIVIGQWSQHSGGLYIWIQPGTACWDPTSSPTPTPNPTPNKRLRTLVDISTVKIWKWTNRYNNKKIPTKHQ